MTRNVATTELKAKLSEILGDVERGETIGVTRHGKTIARIVPEHRHDPEQVRQAIEGLRNLRASLPKKGVTLEDVLKWRHEGHRY
jgi:prevent-host-death family protein